MTNAEQAAEPLEPLAPLGRILVLDLETRDDILLTGMITSARAGKPFVQMIAGYSALSANEKTPGEWTVESLASSTDDENDILAAIDAALQPAPRLVTYNGLRHDLPVLRRRIMRLRRYELAAALGAADLPHLDLYAFPRVPPGGHHGSLQDRCAGLGIDSKTYLDGNGDTRSRSALKSEVDVVATFVLLLHELAAARAHGPTWGRGLEALRAGENGRLATMGHLHGLMGSAFKRPRWEAGLLK